MKTTIKFTDGTTLSAVKITGGGRYVQGASRDVLTFELAQDAASFEQLVQAFTPDNCAQITLSADGKESLHEHYTMRLSLGVEDVAISPETTEGAAWTEPRWVVEMARKTFAEREMEKQSAAVEALTAKVDYISMMTDTEVQ